uniref:Uncharacterized protein n=1 Tax=uncultured prokaryote TaxID=198431 RepID=A0A0H5QKG3_9ZZZZ|nr:hypothetical protein [uncultured prokaryote]
MLSLHIVVTQVLGDYQVRATVHEQDPMLGGPTVIMARTDLRSPVWSTDEGELSNILSTLCEWAYELYSGHPNG